MTRPLAWLRTRTARLASTLVTIGQAIAPDALSLGKLLLCCGWAWLPFEGLARAIAWDWHTAAQCWGGFCGGIAFLLWRPSGPPAVEVVAQRAAQMVLEGLGQRTEGR